MSKKIIFKILIGLFLTFIILLSFLPLIVRKIAVSNSKEWIGRSISLEKFKLNYFTGTIKLIDFKMYEADDKGKFVAFDTLIIDTEPYRFISNELVIERLYLKGLNVNVIMNDSSFNFDDLITRFGSSPEGDTSAIESNETPMVIELSNLELSDGLLTMHDAEISTEMELRNLDFFIPYIRLDQSHTSEAGLKFDFKNGGFFQSKIDIDPIGGEFEAEIMLKRLDISGYNEFAKKYIELGPFSGQTDLDLKLSGNINTPEKTIVSGNFQLNDFELMDQDKLFVSVKKLNVNLKEIDPAQGRFVMDTIQLSRPYMYFEMYDSTNNLLEFVNRIMPAEDSTLNAEDGVEETSSSDIFYAVNTLLIENGIIDFIDDRTGEPFKYHLSKIEMKTSSISSEADWIALQSDMLLNERGSLVAQLGVDPNDPMNLSVDYTIKDFMLSDLNIYSRHYMGFPILYGDMYYKAHTTVHEGQITSENKLIIHNVELGNKGGGLYDLPLKFALFLLKDKDGVITLDVPVRGDLKDPKVSVRKIVWNTFKNLIIKAAAAPVKLLSGLIGANPKDIEFIEYDFMDTTLTEGRQKQLALLLELEQQKPDLEIEMLYLNDSELEKQEIAMAEAGKMYEKKSGKDYLQNKADFEAFVKGEVQSDTISVMDACLSLVNNEAIDSILTVFNEKRLADVLSFISTQNDSTEIIVRPLREGAAKNLGSMPKFEIKYGMKEEHLD